MGALAHDQRYNTDNQRPIAVEFHPSKIPVEKTYDIADESAAADVGQKIAEAWSPDSATGFKVLMPKDKKLAKRMGYTVMTTVNYFLRKANTERNVRYWVYHEDDSHYAIVLIDSHSLESLGL